MTDMDYNTYDGMAIEYLATVRENALERVALVTDALKKTVKEQYQDGVSIKKISRQAGVTRRTIYAWLAE